MKKQIIITAIITVIICITGTSLAAYKLKAEQVSFDKSNTNLNVEDVQAAIDELGLSLSNSKQLLAEAITNKGVATSNNDSFKTMANNIGKIKNSITKTYIGSGWAGKNNTFNCTKIENYKELTVDNFGLVMTGAYGTGSNDGGKTGTMTYNASSGILNIASAVSSNNAPTYDVYCFH